MKNNNFHNYKSLRRSLLLKIISNASLTKEDLDSIIELTAYKVIDNLHAQSMTLYMVEVDKICFKYVYYAPSLWNNNEELKQKFKNKREELLKLKLPLNTGLIGNVIQYGKSNIFNCNDNPKELHHLHDNIEDFKINSMLTVPLKDRRAIGAIQVLNKDQADEQQNFTQKDLLYLEEIAEYTSALILRILDPNYEINEQDSAKYIARFTDTKLITDKDEIEVDPKLIELVGSKLVRKTGIFPLKYVEQQSIAVLMKNPMDFQSRETFRLKTDLLIDEVSVIPNSLFEHLCQKYYQSTQNTQDILESSQVISEITNILDQEYSSLSAVDESNLELLKTENEASAPIVKLVNKIIEDAYFSGSSDIHIEPQENKLLVRYRIDGVCIEKLSLPVKSAGSVVARIKIMCDLDIAQRRLPQDGRIDFQKFTNKQIKIDIRVATCPTLFGEKIVLRILDKARSALPITALGFSEENLAIYRNCIKNPYGMILHCGPTGSGKSMTLFSALQEISSPMVNIQTVEDPIEYTLSGVNQMQVNKTIGLTFANTLRSFLRMDPDIILVGEIRDKETAEIAVEASLTGHLLLSTLHTNDAPSTIARFTDMDIDPFMVSTSLLAVCAQRLIRRVCNKCSLAHQPSEVEKNLLTDALGWNGEIVKSNEKGCPYCEGTGMRGRIGIHEIMENNPEITRLINSNAEAAKIKETAVKTGMKSLHQDAMIKVRDKITTIQAALAVAPPPKFDSE